MILNPDAALFCSLVCSDPESSIEPEPTAVPVQDATEAPFMWTQPAALLRISLYGEHRNKFTSPRMKKKAVWEILAVAMRSQGYHVSGPQCDSKRKGMLRVYKEAFANNKKSGSGRATCPYFTVLDDLLCKYPNIVPLATASSSRTRPVHYSFSSSTCSSTWRIYLKMNCIKVT